MLSVPVLRMGFLLWLLLAALAGMILASQQGPAASSEQGSACMLPCWAGIMPGVTSADEAKLALASRADVRGIRQTGSDELRFNVAGIDHIHDGIVYLDKRNVRGLLLQGIQPRLWDLLDQLGAPDCAVPVYGSRDGSQLGISLIWTEGERVLRTILIGDPGRALQQEEARTQDLQISSDGPGCTGGSVPWPGFVPLWHYQPDS